MLNNNIQTVKEFFRKHEYISIFLIACFFILIRLPGTDLPLHQDEYKWPQIVNPSLGSETEIPHPPLSQFIYRTAGELVGFNVNFRFVPLFFGTINLLLLYLYMRMKWGRKPAFIGVSLFTLSYFSTLASLMVDTDGQILPFFFLVALIAYEKVKRVKATYTFVWGVLLVLSLIGGLFVKVSFFLPIVAITFDFLWLKRHVVSKKDLLRYTAYGLGFIGFMILALSISQKIFPFFSLEKSLTYWQHFWNTDRNWFQTLIQLAKVFLYTSPFFILISLYINKKYIREVLPHIAYLVCGFIFYIVLFDFSIGALDRYFQFIIVPLSVIGGLSIFGLLKEGDVESKRKKEFLLLGIVVSLVLILLQTLPHYIPTLHPKSAWISRILSLQWNFVYPFSGGSGPLGFYVSFLFMALSWLISVGAIILGLIKKEVRVYVCMFLIPLGFAYNAVFTEEYLFGYFNGFAPKLMTDAVEFMKNERDILFVTPYNDNGGNEIREVGKYRRRLYIDPKFEVNMNEKIDYFNAHKEHYFVLNVPRFDSESMYQKFFDTCDIIYNTTDKKMSAIVYDCRKAPDLKNI